VTWHAPCRSDPLLEWIRDGFLAQPVRVPSTRVAPLVAFSRTDKKYGYLGNMAQFLVEPARSQLLELEKKPLESSPVPDLARHRSRDLDVSAGADVLGGLLSGMGLPVIPTNLLTEIQRHTRLSLFFTDVEHVWIDNGVLGNILKGRVLQVDNTALTSALRDRNPDALFLMDSVFQSTSFGVSAERDRSATVKFDVEVIDAALASASAGVSVSRHDDNSLLFEKNEPLGFAFTCLRVMLNEQDGITALVPYHDRVELARPRAVRDLPVKRTLLTPDIGLLEWSDPEPD
jgi:hypothetical protein